MAIINDNGTGMYMPVAPAYGGGYGGFGGAGGDWWGILLLIALLNGGMFGGFGGWGGAGMMGLGIDFPWLMNGQQNIQATTANGFRDAQLSDGITSVRDGIAALAQQLCNCCGDMRQEIGGVNLNIAQTGNAVSGAVRDGFYNAEIAAAGRQTANMQQLFGIQSTMQQGFCDNRAATADLKYTVATEGCADRQAGYQNTRDIIDAIRSGNQGVMDKLCQLELDGVKNQLAAAQRDNANLQNQVILATERADRTAQTGTIIDGIYNRLASCPIDTTPVYGRQAIFQCPVNVNGNNGGCGCGNNSFVN